jgi:hypothetical protein
MGASPGTCYVNVFGFCLLSLDVRDSHEYSAEDSALRGLGSRLLGKSLQSGPGEVIDSCLARICALFGTQGSDSLVTGTNISLLRRREWVAMHWPVLPRGQYGSGDARAEQPIGAKGKTFPFIHSYRTKDFGWA